MIDWKEESLEAIEQVAYELGEVTAGNVLSVQPITVEVTGLGPARVAMKACMDDVLGWAELIGVARYANGKIVAERHVQPLQRAEGVHKHENCSGLLYGPEAGSFRQYHMRAGAAIDSRFDFKGVNAHMPLCLEIAGALLDPTYSHCVIGGLEGYRAARQVRGIGGRALCNDLALNMALARRGLQAAPATPRS
ncbi:MAG TPA: hypothetical protein VLE99_03245 [Candidatus Saccharimonadales bacterium]|nr:hypothetical protein [Candidatus Saccharimonadales bacterium]